MKDTRKTKDADVAGDGEKRTGTYESTKATSAKEKQVEEYQRTDLPELFHA